jgi:hypothetical protein
VMEHRVPGVMNRRDTVPWREALEAEPRFGPLHDEEATHEHATEADGLVAQIASFSSIGALPPDRLEAALAACRAVLARHGVDRLTLTYKTLITWTTTTS